MDPVDVGILLDFKNKVSGVKGVQASCPEQHGPPMAEGNAMQHRRQRSLADGGLEGTVTDAATQAHDELGIFRCILNVPAFRLGLTAQPLHYGAAGALAD